MSNPPRVKGTRAESAAAQWLSDEFGVPITRGPLRGNADRGDLFGVPDYTVEVKNVKVPALKQWGRELAAEMGNGGTSNGVVLWSPPGVGMASVDRWVALEWGTSSSGCVPHVGALNALHKFVTVMDDHAYATSVDGILARLAGTWAAEVRERWPHLTRRASRGLNNELNESDRTKGGAPCA